MVSVREIVARVGGRIAGDLTPDHELRRVVVNRHNVQPGDLFVAIANDHHDSHRFVPDAYENGAAAVMVNEAWYQHHNLHNLSVIIVPDTRRALATLTVASQPPTGTSHPMSATPHQALSLPSVPTVPLLYSDVELVGEMQESAFQDPQWLIKRSDQFIQVSELLYRVAEQIDGEQTLQQIAEQLTGSTEWLVTEDNVSQIIQTKLIPLGIVAPEDDDVYDASSHQRQSSPLALNLRTKVIGPHIIDPVAGVLQFLFAPIVLIPVLVVAAIAHWWLYFVHGMMQGLIELVYSPVLMLVLLPIIILGVAFHEFGHASALRYGGGRARGMGFGFYLIYPAFYTDTTDSYRLGRWARVRTDLGGFYFHLIFILGIIGVYHLTGYEFLLLAVFVINFDIVRQLVPFGRFDGYWTLADLTGIPDLFTYVGPVLKDVASFRRRAPKVVNLKPWVKRVFVGYILLTVPLLTALMVFFIMRLPRIVQHITTSGSLKVDEFRDARIQGDWAMMALAITEQLILLLQFFGIGLMLYLLGKRLVLLMIRGWKNPSPIARIGSAVGLTTLLLFLTYAWVL